MPTVSYRDFTGTDAENYQRYFVPAIDVPPDMIDVARRTPSPAALHLPPLRDFLRRGRSPR
ncbi:MAG: hypothetical protein ACRDWI_20180 [Jiangellaceae bacterium]